MSVSQVANTKVPKGKADLKVLFTPNKTETGFRVHITLDVQRTTKRLWSAEENTCFSWRVDFANAFEYHVPVGATKVRRCPEASNGILLGVDIVNHDVGCVVRFEFGRQILGEKLLAKKPKNRIII